MSFEPKNLNPAPAGAKNPQPDVAALLKRIEELEAARNQPAAPVHIVMPPSNDAEAAMRRRQEKQAAAGLAPHPPGYGELQHGQVLRDGTKVEGRRVDKDGQTDYLPVPVTFRMTPEGKIIDGGVYDGRFM